MPTARVVLVLTALALTPVLTACDRFEPGDGTEGDGTEGTGGTTESLTEGTSGTEDTEDTGADTTTTGAWDHVPADSECTLDLVGRTRACEGGVQFCATDHAYPEAALFWGPCLADPVCVPGESEGCLECFLDTGGEPALFDNCEDDGTSTPLVLSFDAGPVRYASSSAAFDLGPQCGATDWPSAATPWLALDRDGSGGIEAGRELFGSATVLSRGGLADNGFTALAELDHDRDGRISAADPAFARLLLWADHDGDRRSTAWELTPLADAGVIAIGLTYRNDERCDARANCEVERAAFTFRDPLGRERVGEVIDVHLSCQ